MLVAITVVTMMSVSQIPALPDPPPDVKTYMPRLEQNAQSMLDALKTTQFAGGPLNSNQTLCLVAQLGLSSVDGMRKMLGVSVSQGRAPTTSQIFGPRLQNMEDYFKKVWNNNNCRGPDGDAAYRAIGHLKAKGYSLQVLGGLSKLQTIGGQTWVAPTKEDLAAVGTVALMVGILLFAPEAAPVLIVAPAM